MLNVEQYKRLLSFNILIFVRFSLEMNKYVSIFSTFRYIYALLHFEVLLFFWGLPWLAHVAWRLFHSTSKCNRLSWKFNFMLHFRTAMTDINKAFDFIDWFRRLTTDINKAFDFSEHKQNIWLVSSANDRHKAFDTSTDQLNVAKLKNLFAKVTASHPCYIIFHLILCL